MATTEPPATVFVLSAQPIDENGVIGFEDRNPLTAETDTSAPRAPDPGRRFPRHPDLDPA
jgi:hypothetical protein